MKKTLPATLLGLLAAGVVFTGLLVFLGNWLKPDNKKRVPPATADEIKASEFARDVSADFKNPARIYQDVNYAEGPSAKWYPKEESPILAQLVAEGKLPPVAERVGPEPVVVQGVEGNGRYGGTWVRLAVSVGDVPAAFDWRLNPVNGVRFTPMGNEVVPQVFKSFTASPDKRVWTAKLRKGMRWSDGVPFNSKNMMDWWKWSLEYWKSPQKWLRNDIPGSVSASAPDDFTFIFTFKDPYPLFPEAFAVNGAGMVSSFPSHYLLPFHPDRFTNEWVKGDSNRILGEMKAWKAQNVRGFWSAVQQNWNPEKPRLGPWVLRRYKPNPPYEFVRNPYYYGVDSEGRQLPYVDRLFIDIKTPDMIAQTASLGEVTMQERHLRFEDHVLLSGQAKNNDYRVLYWYQSTRSPWVIFPNLNRRYADVESESLSMSTEETRIVASNKYVLLNDKRFRQALSVAINRKAIIDLLYAGFAEPGQVDPGKESPYHHPELFNAFIQYDPPMASRLLDEIGLTNRDSEGMRTFPDGRRMQFFVEYTDYTSPEPNQFVSDYWAEVGLRITFRFKARPVFSIKKNGRLSDFIIWTSESEFNPFAEPRMFVPVNSETHQAIGFANWYRLGGLRGTAESKRSGVVEPPADHPLRKALELYELAIREPDSERRNGYMKQILQINAENLFTIGVSTSPPQLAVVKNDFRNVPKNMLMGAAYGTPLNGYPETYFFLSNKDGAGAIASIKQSMLEIVPIPRDGGSSAANVKSSGTGWFLKTLKAVLWIGVVVFLVVISIRFPYIGRRLLIMIPTLAVISIIVFGIIQIPPGDFIENRIKEAEISGDVNALQNIEDLKASFHTEDGAFKSYLRWSGLYWFASFKDVDQGLLQGSMGRSMEYNKPVNDIVGDRILLTMAISALSLILTWLIAIPTGIYSAVKQYSFGDYFFTSLGFIGMSFPGFLLALVLMFLSYDIFGVRISGLFSAAYGAQPDWTWDKVLDLLKHIWVPVVVLGIGSTAGMIRVMRANLLDELKKQYVTTARAKGVPPIRLLLKYPVRIALNPFISGIGGIFPALVSGGAIVAIVLSLPTVGPLMLSALTSEDIYIAGGMLMVLSFLGVVGTLVSDLLLLALDPRIRFTSGVK